MKKSRALASAFEMKSMTIFDYIDDNDDMVILSRFCIRYDHV